MPGASEWYESVKGIQDAARGVTSGAIDQVRGVEDAVQTVTDPIKQAISGDMEEADLFD